MRKVIAAMNITLDGFCDHTAGIADDELHQHYADLLASVGTLVYGRITYQLMESYWPAIAKNPTGNKATDDFAALMDSIPKVVFSHTLQTVAWKSATLATRDIQDEISDLKQKAGKDILVGSPSLIVQLTQLGLIDEYQICIHPVILGKGLPLFTNITEKIPLTLVKTKTFNAGPIVLYYRPIR